MTDWPKIIREIMKTERVTQRRLEAASGVSRSTFKRFLRGDTSIRIDDFEKLLDAIGYSFDAVKIGEPSPIAVRPRRLAAAPMRFRCPAHTRAAGRKVR